MPRPVFVINPQSHTVNGKGSVLERVDSDAERIVLHKFEDLHEHIETLIEAPRIFIEGGDGTVQGVLTALFEYRPKPASLPEICVLPGGQTNLIAKIIGLKKSSVKEVTKLASGHINTRIAMPLIRIKDKRSAQRFDGFLLSTGALPAATEYCVENVHSKGVGGSVAVAVTLLKTLIGGGEDRQKILASSKISIKSNSENRKKHPHKALIATTLPKLILGLDPFWGAEDGQIRLTMANDDSKLLRGAMKSWIGRGHNPKKMDRLGFHSWNTNKARIKHKGPVVLDGETIFPNGGQFTIKPTPPLTFIS